MDEYKRFTHKEANFRFMCPGRENLLIESILNNRKILDAYIARFPPFKDALAPLPLLGPDALPPEIKENGAIPEIVLRMDAASRLTGLGPMAAVAGGFAQMAMEKALKSGADHVVIENGGDICLKTASLSAASSARRPVSPLVPPLVSSLMSPLVLGIYPGNDYFRTSLAFSIPPGTGPLAVCSSSGTMGHSLSFGKCDLATVCAADGFLADAAATLAGNLVKKAGDIQPALDRVLAVPGVEGVLIIYRDKIGMAGKLPELVANKDPDTERRITRADGG